MSNGNLFKTDNRSEIYDIRGKKIFSIDKYSISSGNEIIVRDGDIITVYDENGKLVQTGDLKNYMEFKTGMYITRNGNFFGCKNTVRHGIIKPICKILSNGNYFMYDYINYCLLDKKFNLIKKYPIPGIRGDFLTDGMIFELEKNFHSLYDWNFTLILKINCNDILVYGNYFIVNLIDEFEMYELRENGCLRLFKLPYSKGTYGYNIPKEWTRNKHNMFDMMTTFCVNEKYIFIGTLYGDIIKMKKDGTVINIIHRGAEICRLQILKSGKMMFCHRYIDHIEFHIIETI